MFGQKPRDYHNWDYDTRKAYDKKQQEAEDLEYDLQRQKDDAERASNDARHAARRHSAEMEEVHIQMDDLHAENSSLRNFLQHKDSDYKLAHSHESYYNKLPLGVRIYIASGREKPTELEERVAWNVGQEVFNAILKQHVLLDEEAKIYAAKEKAEILALFEGKSIFVEEIENGYGGSDPHYVLYPWFIVTTPIGHIKIGWRKRVINIDWTRTLQTKKAEELFPNENVTKSGNYDETRYIHAWGYDKAKEYLDVIHKDVPNDLGSSKMI